MSHRLEDIWRRISLKLWNNSRVHLAAQLARSAAQDKELRQHRARPWFDIERLWIKAASWLARRDSGDWTEEVQSGLALWLGSSLHCQGARDRSASRSLGAVAGEGLISSRCWSRRMPLNAPSRCTLPILALCRGIRVTSGGPPRRVVRRYISVVAWWGS